MGPLPQEDQACCADNVDLYHPFVLVNLKKPVEDRYLVVERFLGPDFLSRDPQYGEVEGGPGLRWGLRPGGRHGCIEGQYRL